VSVYRKTTKYSEFDGGYMPARSSVEGRWKRIDRTFRRGEALSPVSLYKLGDFHSVLDGNHRVSVTRYHGLDPLDALVTEFYMRLPEGRVGRADAVTYKSRELEAIRIMYSYEAIKQRREEIIREAEQDRLGNELRRFCRRRAGVSNRALALIWESKRIVGRLFKLLRSLRDAD
jgi:hypothetical protein